MTKLHVGKRGMGKGEREKGGMGEGAAVRFRDVSENDRTFHPRHPTNQQNVVTDVLQVVAGSLPQMSAVQLSP
jgi:hypothetical protein